MIVFKQNSSSYGLVGVLGGGVYQQRVDAACKCWTVCCLVLFVSFHFGVFWILESYRIMELYEVVIGRASTPEPYKWPRLPSCA